MVDSKENYKFDLRVKGLRDATNEAMPTQVRMDEREMNTLSLK